MYVVNSFVSPCGEFIASDFVSVDTNQCSCCVRAYREHQQCETGSTLFVLEEKGSIILYCASFAVVLTMSTFPVQKLREKSPSSAFNKYKIL